MRPVYLLLTILSFNSIFAQKQDASLNDKYILVIHGGAGTILKSQMSAGKEKAYTDALTQALQTGYAVLKRGGTSLDAVEAAVRFMEDNPLFNAGKGAVFTNEGKNELDAAIMNGQNLAAGSVAGVTVIKNPVTAARAVMEKSSHVMMISSGAEKFARSVGIEIVDPSYFRTDDRWKGLQRARKDDSANSAVTGEQKTTAYRFFNKDDKFGTVGAVALDRHGNLAAATSTGGMTNKKFGRVGDVPVIGAGTYANNNTCAISCTGWGEYFIRLVMAKSISDMMEFGKMSLQQAANRMILERLPELGGDGGLIAVDRNGNYAMPFNTEGMYRGVVRADGKVEIRIYKD